MKKNFAKAVWEGNLAKGTGKIEIDSIGFTENYNFGSRFEEGQGTNPEQLIGAAHAGCFSMALAHALSEKGFVPKEVLTKAEVTLEKGTNGFRISNIYLKTKCRVPKVDEKTFWDLADEAKINCPVSKALAGTNIELEASLIKEP